MAAKVATAFPALAGTTFSSAHEGRSLPACDAAIATLWSSAYPVLHARDVRAKFYFVQDNEPQFYPAGAGSALAEETYRFGFPGIVNTPGLAEVYRSYGNPAVSFVPAVDVDRYHPADPPRPAGGTVRVFFYGRPKTSRNAFGLGIAALAQLKRDYGERVEVICAGENWSPSQFGLAGQIRNLGVLQSLEEVAALYRSCDIGLVFMFTKHPSYQPFEFMASGHGDGLEHQPRHRVDAARRRELPADAAAADPHRRAPRSPGRGRRAAGADRGGRSAGGPALPLGGPDRARVGGDMPPGRCALLRRAPRRRRDRYSSSAIRGASRLKVQ